MAQTFLQSVNRTYDRSAAILNLPEGLSEQIKLCNSVYQVRFSVKIQGKLRIFTGWRANHSEHQHSQDLFASLVCMIRLISDTLLSHDNQFPKHYEH